MGGSEERCEGKRYMYEDRDVATNRRYIDGTIIHIMKFDLTINVDGNPAQIYSLLLVTDIVFQPYVYMITCM